MTVKIAYKKGISCDGLTDYTGSVEVEERTFHVELLLYESSRRWYRVNIRENGRVTTDSGTNLVASDRGSNLKEAKVVAAKLIAKLAYGKPCSHSIDLSSPE